MASSVIKSQHRVIVGTDSAGNRCYAIMPALNAGILQLGSLADGTLLTNGNASAALPAGTLLGATTLATTSTTFASNMNAMASDIRPISMGVRWMSTENANTAKGELAIVQLGANAAPGLSSSAAAGGTAITSLIAGLTSAQQITSVANAFDAKHAQMQPVVEEACAIWKPELPNSATYYSASGNGEPCTGFVVNRYTDANGSEFNFLPGGPYERVVRIDGTTSATTADTIQPNPNRLPMLIFAFTGCNTSATIGELEITINWEFIPEELTGNIIPVTTSLSNPLEMAHASNVLENIPNVAYPKIPEDPQTKMLLTAQRAAPASLYNANGTVSKEGVEGTSFFKKIGSLALGAAPLLSKIPGIGGILSTGAAMIGNFLS